MFVLILGDSVNRVFHKEVADMINVGRDISTFVKQITLSIVSLSIVPFTMIVVAGPEIFNIFLGQRWLMSGVFAQAMAIWSFSNLLYLSILPLYGVLNKQKQYTRFTITTLALRAGIIIVMGASNMDVVLTLYVFSIANFVVLIWQFMYILHVSGIEYRWTMSKVFGKIAQVLPMVAILFLIRYLWVVDQKMYLSLALVASSPYVYMYYIRDTKDIRRIFFKKPM
jgi:O-antigen/teichoic acid export membrane protein